MYGVSTISLALRNDERSRAGEKEGKGESNSEAHLDGCGIFQIEMALEAGKKL